MFRFFFKQLPGTTNSSNCYCGYYTWYSSSSNHPPQMVRRRTGAVLIGLCLPGCDRPNSPHSATLLTGRNIKPNFDYSYYCCVMYGMIAQRSKKNLNASRPSEHPTQGEKCQNASFGGVLGCKDETYSIRGFQTGSPTVAKITVITLRQQSAV